MSATRTQDKEVTVLTVAVLEATVQTGFGTSIVNVLDGLIVLDGGLLLVDGILHVD